MSIPAAAAAQRGRELIVGPPSGAGEHDLVDHAAEQVFQVLGQLKGGAMKLGQALSVAEAAIPPKFGDRFREALVKLQAEAPPMPTAQMHAMLDKQLGTGWRKRFADFDDSPVGAASIGQVHRAVWHDGREVAVKVQYPEAEEALKADLRLLEMFAGAFATVFSGANIKKLVGEFLARTEDELDYRIEAAYQRTFAKALAGDEKFYVPRVLAGAPKVLVTEWMDGVPLSRIIAEGTREQRDRAGIRLAEFALSTPATVGLLHSDPHPGNFQLRPDGALGVIDFGACIALPNGIPPAVGRMATCALAEDYQGLEQVLRAERFIQPGAAIDLGPFRERIGPMVAGFEWPRVHFTREMLQADTARALAPENLSLTNAQAVSAPADKPEYAMLIRVFAGVIGILAQLDADGPFLGLFQEWLPEFTVPGNFASLDA
ncbi:AarF/ABC1/UbiB kinase family protein [Nocardia uniformis]|uniref:AarF/ABC1/UbiB kinase family protein n=2 Tax=Nocardia uniformis TaxID=53432 RepID=A0A849CA03_9NOCA|nr:AarF/ABC1/UbiB kinase family protein [Nocardia uniformis]